MRSNPKNYNQNLYESKTMTTGNKIATLTQEQNPNQIAGEQKSRRRVTIKETGKEETKEWRS